MNEDIPEGTTHYHEGNESFFPHYIKVVYEGERGVVYTWLTGYPGGPCWNDIPAHDKPSNYKNIGELDD